MEMPCCACNDSLKRNRMELEALILSLGFIVQVDLLRKREICQPRKVAMQ